MTWQQGVPGADWDDKLFNTGGPFLQSSHWAAFQVELGRKVFFASGNGWQSLAILEPSRFSTRLYAPYGPFITNKAATGDALQALKKLAVQQKALFVRSEPTGEVTAALLEAHALKRALKDIQQPLTWVKDITLEHDELFAEMSATNRNLYRNHPKKGLSLHASQEPTDMRYFLEMIHDVAAHTGITPHADYYYQAMADVLIPRGAGTIYVARFEGQPIASAFVFDSPSTRYYAHAGSFGEYRKLHAGSALLTQMILDAKANGQTSFDFCGVAPEGAPSTHRWAGFTKFKQSFGGDYKAYLGTWEMPVHAGYHVYRGVYKAKKMLKK